MKKTKSLISQKFSDLLEIINDKNIDVLNKDINIFMELLNEKYGNKKTTIENRCKLYNETPKTNTQRYIFEICEFIEDTKKHFGSKREQEIVNVCNDILHSLHLVLYKII